MAHWAVMIPDEQAVTERTYQSDTLELDPALGTLASTPPGGADRPEPGDDVLVLSGDPPAVVAVGRFAGFRYGEHTSPGPLTVTYHRRLYDAPQPIDGPAPGGPLTRLDPERYARVVARLAPAGARTSWLVSVNLPIEASSPAEAVARFWSYVRELGPRELPAFVSPAGDELAMQAYVLGEQANLDPEEDAA